jgi:hypothetical protein
MMAQPMVRERQYRSNRILSRHLVMQMARPMFRERLVPMVQLMLQERR